MANVKNNKANVGSAKGVAGGYIFWAPAGTQLPTDCATPLGEAFVNLGFVGDDGVSMSDEIDTEDHADMNGEIVDSSRTGYKATLTTVLMELKKATQELYYGSSNVTDNGGLLTVHNRGDEGPHGVLVLELLLKGKRRLRKVCPDAQIVEMGELKAVSSDIYAREATFNLYKDESGDYWTDYAESTETVA